MYTEAILSNSTRKLVVWYYQNADCSFKTINLLRVIYCSFRQHTFVPYVHTQKSASRVLYGSPQTMLDRCHCVSIRTQIVPHSAGADWRKLTERCVLCVVLSVTMPNSQRPTDADATKLSSFVASGSVNGVGDSRHESTPCSPPQKKRPPFILLISVKNHSILMIFGKLKPEKIWHKSHKDLSRSPVGCSHFTLEIQKKSFSTVLFIHASDLKIFFYSSY